MRVSVIAVLLAAILLVAAFVSVPSKLVNTAQAPALPDDLDSYLAGREQAAAEEFGLVEGTEKRVRWLKAGEKTPYALVYLHGFSGSRQGLVPATDRIADAIGANLFETRLAGHGRERGALEDIEAEQWLADAAEALAIGARIGERVIVMGTSTGATLALAMADHRLMDDVAAIIMVSPNFQPHDGRSKWLTGPGGLILLRLTVGESYSFEPRNAAQARFWSTTYPSDALVEMLRLVDLVNDQLPLTIGQSLLTVYSSHDQVVSPDATLEALKRIEARHKRTIEFGEVGDLMNHVLAGDILSPETTDEFVSLVVDFIGEVPRRD